MTTLATSETVEAAAWTIRLEQPIDLDQIHEVHQAAFAGSQEADLVDAIRSSAAFVQGLSLVAVTDDGSVLGHVLLSRIELVPDDADAERLAVLALAPIAVLPQHQGRGIGTALLHEAIGAADTRDEPMIAVVGAPSLYERFGFVPAADQEIRGPYDDAGAASQVRLRPGARVPAGALVYTPAFSAL
jgi:putative acetyltransferase